MMKKAKITAVITALAVTLAAGGAWYNVKEAEKKDLPQLVSYIDTDDGSVYIEDEEVPLASKPVVKTKTTTKTDVKRTKMKTKAKKSSTKTKRSKSVKNSSKKSKTKKVDTQTTVQKTVTTSLKKNSKIKTVKTTTKTTVKTTTTAIATKATAKTAAKAKTYVGVRTIAPRAHANVLKAYETLNFKVLADSSVNYSGKFDAAAQLITVRSNSDEAIYHELGHFVAFLAGNADTKSDFKAIYAKEIKNFKGTRNNDAYIKSTSAEYFAESYQDYIERPGELKKARPQTYNYIKKCVDSITDSRVNMIKKLYASKWK